MSAKQSAAALVLGALFGLGLTVSEMVNPQKVQDFLDFSGRFDPSLCLVMGGALLITLVSFPRILRRDRPLLAPAFHLPAAQQVDAKLLIGAALFGVGWGLSGFCPGPALLGVASGSRSALIFVMAMLLGMALHRAWFPQSRRRRGEFAR